MQCFTFGAVHLHFTACDHGYPQSLGYVVAMFETSPFVVTQQPADADPYTALASFCQLLKMNTLICGVIR